ncbi:CBS domain-containing protein [Streptomyces sp. NPDC017254]|uniref:CBS domain-containing protein n=1 Tax=unclassified Streptomyces TaxID=2593676 RepID=UPI0037B4F6AF
MTLVRMPHRPKPPTPALATVADTVYTAGLRVGDDMTVEVALSVMAGAGTGHLLVCDDDGQRTGLVTRAQLATVRDSPAYTDRIQLRDLSGDGGAHTSAAALRAARPPRPRAFVTSCATGEQDATPGAPTPVLVLA